MNFIKLTLHNDGKTVFINAEKIADIIDGNDKTQVTFGEDHYYYIKESAEEILAKIQANETIFEEVKVVEVPSCNGVKKGSKLKSRNGLVTVSKVLEFQKTKLFRAVKFIREEQNITKNLILKKNK